MKINGKIVFIIADMIDFSRSMRARAIGRFNNHIPIGVLSLMTMLENNNFKTILYDNTILRLNNESFFNMILNENSDSNIFCFSLNCINIFKAKDLVVRLKKHNENFIFIAGGPHVTLFEQDCYPFFDYYVKGEGEYVLLDLIKSISINVFVTKTISGDRIKELDDLPIINRDLININNYDRKSTLFLGKKVDNILSSRGCSFNCKFCNTVELWNRKFYAHSAQRLIDEIKLLIEKYGTEVVYIRDDNFVNNRKRVIEFCSLLEKNNIHIEFQTYARIDLIDDELLKIMREAGFISLFFGIESGSDNTLKYIRKKYNRKAIYKGFDLIRKYDFKISTGFLFGFPYETKEDIDITIQTIKDIQPDWSFFQMVVGFPVSDMYYECLNNNFVQERVGSFFTIKPKYLDFNFLADLEQKYEGEFNWRRYSEKQIYYKF